MTKLTGKQTSFAEYYTDHKNKETFNNGLESARAAGYKGNDNVLTVTACRTLTKANVKQAISDIRAENKVRVEYNQEIALAELNKAFGYLLKSVKAGNIQAIQALTSVIREKNAISGLHSQTILTDKLPEQKRMDAKEEELAKDFADWYLRQKYPRKQEAG